MKTKTKLFLFIVIIIQFSCKTDNKNEVNASEPPGVSQSKEKPFANIHFASKKDTSCGMPLSAGLEDTVQLNDKIYGFCSKECKDEFVNKLKTEKKQ